MNFSDSHESFQSERDNGARSDDNDKKKKRVSQACDLCNKRKVRCDGNRPCQTCLKAKVDCVYHRVDFRHHKGYNVKQLQSQIDVLEKQLFQERSRAKHFEELVSMMSSQAAPQIVPAEGTGDRLVAAQALATMPGRTLGAPGIPNPGDMPSLPAPASILRSNMSSPMAAYGVPNSSLSSCSDPNTPSSIPRPPTMPAINLVVNAPTISVNNPYVSAMYWSPVSDFTGSSKQTIEAKDMPMIESSINTIKKSHYLPNHFRGLELLPTDKDDPLFCINLLNLQEPGMPVGVSNVLLQQVLLSFIKGPYRFFLRPLPDHIFAKHFNWLSPVLKYSVYATILGMYSEELRFKSTKTNAGIAHCDARRMSDEFFELASSECAKLGTQWSFGDILGAVVHAMCHEHRGKRSQMLSLMTDVVERMLIAGMNDDAKNVEASKKLLEKTGAERELGFYINEARRRMFWMLFLYDRIMSTFCDRKFQVSPSQMRVGLARRFESSVIDYVIPPDPYVDTLLEDPNDLVEKAVFQVSSMNRAQGKTGNPYIEPISYLVYHLIEDRVRELRPGTSAKEVRQHAIKLILTSQCDFVPSVPDLTNPLAHFLLLVLLKIRLDEFCRSAVHAGLTWSPILQKEPKPVKEMSLFDQYEERALKIDSGLLAWHRNFISSRRLFPRTGETVSERMHSAMVIDRNTELIYFGILVILHKLRYMIAERRRELSSKGDYKPILSFNFKRGSADIASDTFEPHGAPNPVQSHHVKVNDVRRNCFGMIFTGLNLALTPVTVCASIAITDLLYRQLKEKRFNYHASRFIVNAIFQAASIHLGRSLLCLKAIRTLIHAGNAKYVSGQLSDEELEFISQKIKNWNALRMIIRGYLDIILVAMEKLKHVSVLHFEMFKLTIAVIQAVLNVEQEFFDQVRHTPLFVACIKFYCSRLCPKMAGFLFNDATKKCENWFRSSAKFVKTMEICRRVLIERLPETLAFHDLKGRTDLESYAQLAQHSQEATNSVKHAHYIDSLVKQTYQHFSERVLRQFFNNLCSKDSVTKDMFGTANVDSETLNDIEALEMHFSFFNQQFDLLSSIKETAKRAEKYEKENKISKNLPTGNSDTVIPPLAKRMRFLGANAYAKAEDDIWASRQKRSGSATDTLVNSVGSNGSVDDAKEASDISDADESKAKVSDNVAYDETGNDWSTASGNGQTTPNSDVVEGNLKDSLSGVYFNQGDMNLFSEDYLARQFLSTPSLAEDEMMLLDSGVAVQGEQVNREESAPSYDDGSDILSSLSQTNRWSFLFDNYENLSQAKEQSAPSNLTTDKQHSSRLSKPDKQPTLNDLLNPPAESPNNSPLPKQAANIDLESFGDTYNGSQSFDSKTGEKNSDVMLFDGLWQTVLGENAALYGFFDY